MVGEVPTTTTPPQLAAEKHMVGMLLADADATVWYRFWNKMSTNFKPGQVTKGKTRSEETPEAQKALKRLLFFQPQIWEGVKKSRRRGIFPAAAQSFGAREPFKRGIRQRCSMKIRLLDWHPYGCPGELQDQCEIMNSA